MKRILAAVLAMVLLLSCTACGEKEPEAPVETITELTLWTYPYGNWSDSETVNMLLSQFSSVYPNIRVTVEYKRRWESLNRECRTGLVIKKLQVVDDFI